VATNELFGRFNGGGIVRVTMQELGYNGIERPVDDVGAIIWHVAAPLDQAGAQNSQSPIKAEGRVGDGAADSLYVR